MKAGRAGVSVVDLVDSATSYLLYELDVEVVVFKRTADFCDYLLTFTRMASSRVPDEMAVVTEIDCVAKYGQDVGTAIVTFCVIHASLFLFSHPQQDSAGQGS